MGVLQYADQTRDVGSPRRRLAVKKTQKREGKGIFILGSDFMKQRHRDEEKREVNRDIPSASN